MFRCSLLFVPKWANKNLQILVTQTFKKSAVRYIIWPAQENLIEEHTEPERIKRRIDKAPKNTTHQNTLKKMKSLIFLLFTMAISSSCYSLISGFPSHKADISHKSAEHPHNEVNPIQAARPTENTMKLTNSIKATDAPLLRTNKKTSLKKRFRRSYGYSTKCIPVEKMKCRMFNVNNLKKEFCIKFIKFLCTALDWIVRW